MNETTPTIDPQHTLLLVMDYQPAILANLPRGPMPCCRAWPG